jgi:hypothetical protein
VLVGVAIALAVVVTSRLADRAAPAAATASAPSRLPLLPTGATEPLGSSRARFAELYVNYLLRTYYVPRRGFCRALLKKICTALVRSELAHEDICHTVPNDPFVLAIGRYQHRVGLPVDGKAGPETVRMMLGGDFSNRRGMAATYCGVALPEEDAGAEADGDR